MGVSDAVKAQIAELTRTVAALEQSVDTLAAMSRL